MQTRTKEGSSKLAINTAHMLVDRFDEAVLVSYLILCILYIVNSCPESDPLSKIDPLVHRQTSTNLTFSCTFPEGTRSMALPLLAPTVDY